MNDPADVVTKTGGDRLRDHLDCLSIRKKLVYHRLRDCRGLLTNQIHNAVVHFACEIAWEPILYFAQGAVYLAAQNPATVFSLMDEGLRKNKPEPGKEDVKRVWNYPQSWAKGNLYMQEKLKLIERLVREYRKFYQVSLSESSHAVLLPISKALEVILTVPEQVDREDLILQGAGQLKDALERRKVYNRMALR